MTRFGGAAASAESLSQAGLLNFQAGGYRRAGMLNVGTTLLGGVSAAGSPFLRYGGRV